MNRITYPSLRGRVVIVTGAGRGFGRLIATALVEQGAFVLGTSARNRSELDAAGEEASAAALATGAEGRFASALLDVSNYEDCERAVELATQHFGRVDVLINNAARGPLEANDNYFLQKPKFWTSSPDAYRRMIDTNLTGAFFMARAVAPLMVAQSWGRIINISTSQPTMVMQGLAAYGAAKAGLEVSTVVWAKDLEGTGVTANVLLPGGPADTALIPGGVVGTRAPADYIAGKGATGDEGRVGGLLPAGVIVPPALWLCADDSASFNGRRLVAKDWDSELRPSEAAVRAAQTPHAAPRIM